MFSRDKCYIEAYLRLHGKRSFLKNSLEKGVTSRTSVPCHMTVCMHDVTQKLANEINMLSCGEARDNSLIFLLEIDGNKFDYCLSTFL